jgi:hypothetical protein
MMKRGVWWIAAVLMIFVSGGVFAEEFYQYTDKDGTLRFTDDYNRVPLENQADVKTIPSVESKSQPSPDEQTQYPPAPEEAPAETPAYGPPGEILQETQEESEDEPAPEGAYETDAAGEPTGMDEEYPDETPADETGMTEDAYGEEGLDDSSAESADLPETGMERPPMSDYQVMTGQFDREKKELDKKMERLQREKESVESQDVNQMTSSELNTHEQRVKDLNARINGLNKEQLRFEERVRRFNERLMEKNKASEEGETSGDNS